MPFCPYCGMETPSGAVYCPSCGKALGAPGGSPPTGGASPAGVTLQSVREIVMVKRLLSLREHYDLQDRDGGKLGEGEGNFVQFPAKFVVLGASGEEFMHINGKLLSLRREFDLFDPHGSQLGALKKKLVKLIGHEYWVERGGEELLRIYGDFLEHEYQMNTPDGAQVAQVHKSWLSIRDTFMITITGEIDQRLVVGSVIAIEHEEVTERSH